MQCLNGCVCSLRHHSDLDHARYDWKAPGTLINTNTLEV